MLTLKMRDLIKDYDHMQQVGKFVAKPVSWDSHSNSEVHDRKERLSSVPVKPGSEEHDKS